ncbi:putative 60S ribosomal protein L31-1 [Monocercomonoides exilis]|uniref:putative 60S ribosomal protein L31-1 n=1 Tax=Monocercomonoides exilis TaxID=2049356 RepID=UPI00355AB32B|nr:putative 60S ribosomal protein L31-1 [Monocercomonoides exilis]|eukprot:MONOS_8964.1-p1 / transcript=MONOS_8964.1 / gene=MONOS_8964 / organism=Monocercomonoides_exilis_PA203 / gene_product=60S ribosomal protein L31-1 / transcript_product=60S ribosomal protein L31-1 / location=Mono_scaffold00353:51772-52155(-) / protein_length=128 / sequence_SO=supercontig / SO=protein_coding / is_pseudo=false
MAPKLKKQPKKKQNERRYKGPKEIEMTINLHKACHAISFKKKAPRAIKTIRNFAKKYMRTRDVRLDTKVNSYVWKTGIKNIPRRIRVSFERKLSEDEDAKDKYYVLVKHVPVKSFHYLLPKKIEEAK